MIPRRLSRGLGTAAVDTLLAASRPRFFAAIAALDWYARAHEQWIDELALGDGDRVLEVGSGTGALTSQMSDCGYRVTGLDLSQAMIRRANKNHPYLDFRLGDATSLPYDDDTFDAVVAASVVNVVANAKQVLSEMRRVCKPGGIVSVLVPSTGFTDNDLNALIESLGLTGFSEAALTRWHRGPPKTSGLHLRTVLESVDLKPVGTHTYLDGMLVTATAPA